jgi:hypothetical protein
MGLAFFPVLLALAWVRGWLRTPSPPQLQKCYELSPDDTIRSYEILTK